MKYFIDLDDTLVNSTALNNDAYNFALELFGFDRITTNERITREQLSNYKNLNEIIKIKQQYFTADWLPYRLYINHLLLEKIKYFGKNNCFLWTKADKNRADRILDCCNLRRFFNTIILDEKKDFKSSIPKLKTITNHNKLIIYENNHSFFKNKNCKIIDSIQNSQFNIKGYLIG